ncbi:MAG TPA: RidA family protein [Steroidobacteraceae bacterium]|jgi:enamine deaminase RidA (YjgF/YER057c/UK114 family)|nr:RidA family protein [Steroidobacteraceae bacterium]
MHRPILAALVLALAATYAADAHDIIRHAAPTFPIASSVVVPTGTDLVFLSGMLADVADPKAPAGSLERLGDTATQAKSVLAKIQKELATLGLTMADVVKMNVFLVGDPSKGGRMDFEGLMHAYLGVYGLRPQENKLPARTTVQVAGLPVPGALVEIEVVAARHAAQHEHAAD